MAKRAEFDESSTILKILEKTEIKNLTFCGALFLLFCV